VTEYYREPNNRIQAGFALHIGKLLAQYSSLTANLQYTQKYEATLAICALQALLTNCTELIKAMKLHDREFWSNPITDIPGHWGIRPSFIVENNFPESLTYEKFIEHLRNALSHPTSSDKSPYHPATGYTTISDESGVIVKFRFTDSPWVERGKINSFQSDEDKVSKMIKRLQKNSQLYENIRIIEVNNKSQIYYKERNLAYLPVFKAELSLSALTQLAITLANYLSQPVDDTWDGKIIHQLVA